MDIHIVTMFMLLLLCMLPQVCRAATQCAPTSGPAAPDQPICVNDDLASIDMSERNVLIFRRQSTGVGEKGQADVNFRFDFDKAISFLFCLSDCGMCTVNVTFSDGYYFVSRIENERCSPPATSNVYHRCVFPDDIHENTNYIIICERQTRTPKIPQPYTTLQAQSSSSASAVSWDPRFPLEIYYRPAVISVECGDEAGNNLCHTEYASKAKAVTTTITSISTSIDLNDTSTESDTTAHGGNNDIDKTTLFIIIGAAAAGVAVIVIVVVVSVVLRKRKTRLAENKNRKNNRTSVSDIRMSTVIDTPRAASGPNSNPSVLDATGRVRPNVAASKVGLRPVRPVAKVAPHFINDKRNGRTYINQADAKGSNQSKGSNQPKGSNQSGPRTHASDRVQPRTYINMIRKPEKHIYTGIYVNENIDDPHYYESITPNEAQTYKNVLNANKDASEGKNNASYVNT